MAENNSWISAIQQISEERDLTHLPGNRAVDAQVRNDRSDVQLGAATANASRGNAVHNDPADPIRASSTQQQRDDLNTALFRNTSANGQNQNQAMQDLNRHASQVQVAMAMAAQSFQQLVEATRRITRELQC